MSGGERFSCATFQAEAARRQLAWGRDARCLPSTGSTNDDALAAAKSGAPSGSLIVADHQSHGRGRSGYAWQSPPGDNLLFSLVLRPESPSWPAAALTLSVGLAVRSALAPYGAEPLSVKWPNDVLAGRRKLAGILCEGQLGASGALEAIVIGVGVNVHTTRFEGELAEIATSLALIARAGAPPLQRELLLVELLLALQHHVGACLERGFAELAPEFARHDALLDRAIVVSGARSLSGIARGVDKEGQLLLETPSGIERIASGTVRLAD
jgi:BirA family transcriptional regulator, biotin operon repressor / biotin---[acetyl-CoA-carboxylase] ligase